MASSSLASDNFESWLSQALQNLELDAEVYTPFIVNLLEDSDKEAVEELINNMGVDEAGAKTLIRDIEARWTTSTTTTTTTSSTTSTSTDLNSRLNDIAAARNAAYAESRRGGDAVDADVKQAILAQYSKTEEEEENEEDEEEDEETEGLGNAERVAAEQQASREKSRMAAAEKKERDKEEREKQKKAQEERKKKAQDKAAKGERRR